MDEQRRRQVEAEMARLQREQEERERLRRAEEHKSIQRKCAQERIEQIRNTAVGAKVFQDISEEV